MTIMIMMCVRISIGGGCNNNTHNRADIHLLCDVVLAYAVILVKVEARTGVAASGHYWRCAWATTIWSHTPRMCVMSRFEPGVSRARLQRALTHTHTGLFAYDSFARSRTIQRINGRMQTQTNAPHRTQTHTHSHISFSP